MPTEQNNATILNFGKYKGKALHSVPEDYLIWITQPQSRSWRTKKFKAPENIQKEAEILLQSARKNLMATKDTLEIPTNNSHI